MEKITESEALRMYDEMLDEVYGDFMYVYSASRAFKAVDPIAYRVGFGDYLDTHEDDGYEIEEG